MRQLCVITLLFLFSSVIALGQNEVEQGKTVNLEVQVDGKMTLTAVQEGSLWYKFFVTSFTSNNPTFETVCDNPFGDVTVLLTADAPPGTWSTRLSGNLPLTLSAELLSPPVDVTVFGRWEHTGNGNCIITVESSPYLVTIGNGSGGGSNPPSPPNPPNPPTPPPGGGTNRSPSVNLSLELQDPLFRFATIGGQPIITDRDTVLMIANAQDPDGDDLTYDWVLNGEQQNASSSAVEWKKPPAGQHTVAVLVRDPQGEFDSDQNGFDVYPTFLTRTYGFAGSVAPRNQGQNRSTLRVSVPSSGPMDMGSFGGEIRDNCEGAVGVEVTNDNIFGDVAGSQFVRIIGSAIRGACGIAAVQDDHVLFAMTSMNVEGIAQGPIEQADGHVRFFMRVESPTISACTGTITVLADNGLIRSSTPNFGGRNVSIFGALDDDTCTLFVVPGKTPISHSLSVENIDGSDPLLGNTIEIEDENGSRMLALDERESVQGSFALFIICRESGLPRLRQALTKVFDRQIGEIINRVAFNVLITGKSPRAADQDLIDNICDLIVSNLSQNISPSQVSSSQFKIEMEMTDGEAVVENQSSEAFVTLLMPNGTVDLPTIGKAQVSVDDDESVIAALEGEVTVSTSNETVTVGASRQVTVSGGNISEDTSVSLPPISGSPLPGSSIAEAIDTSNNGFLEDTEVQAAITMWILGQTVPGTGQTIDDLTIRDLIQMWILGQPVGQSAKPQATFIHNDLRVNGLSLSHTHPLERRLNVYGQNILSTQVEVYGLQGNLITMTESGSSVLNIQLLDQSGRPLANGVYLYVVTAYGPNKVWRSEVRKLFVLR